MGYDVSHKIQGVLPKDEKFEKMMGVIKALKEANIYDAPKEVLKYFNADDISEIDTNAEGALINLEDAIKYDKEGDQEVYTIELADIPKQCTQIRFVVEHSY